MLVFEPGGRERWRVEGYLPNAEFRAQLELGIARIAFMNKRWAEAEQRYAAVAGRYAHSASAPDAVYWAGVSRYKATNDHAALEEVARKLEGYPGTIPAKKASIWIERRAGGA